MAWIQCYPSYIHRSGFCKIGDRGGQAIWQLTTTCLPQPSNIYLLCFSFGTMNLTPLGTIVMIPLDRRYVYVEETTTFQRTIDAEVGKSTRRITRSGSLDAVTFFFSTDMSLRSRFLRFGCRRKERLCKVWQSSKELRHIAIVYIHSHGTLISRAEYRCAARCQTRKRDSSC